MSIMAALRSTMEKSGQTRYAISKATGIPESTLSRFAGGKPLRGENVDRLAEHLGLILTSKPGKSARRK